MTADAADAGRRTQAGRNQADSPPDASRLACSPEGISPPRIIQSGELFAGGKLVVIDHSGERYRLMITKNGKLILQK